MTPVDVAERERRRAALRGDGLRDPGPDGSYGRTSRSRTSTSRSTAEHGHRRDRPVGLRQEHVHPLPQPDERHGPELHARRAGPLPRHRPLRHGVDPVEVRRRIGMVFQKPNPFPKSIYDNVAWAPRDPRHEEGPRRARRARADERGALGRGQGPAQEERALALRRPAAAALHRARDRDRAGGAPARRAGLGARPDRDVSRSRS